MAFTRLLNYRFLNVCCLFLKILNTNYMTVMRPEKEDTGKPCHFGSQQLCNQPDFVSIVSAWINITLPAWISMLNNRRILVSHKKTQIFQFQASVVLKFWKRINTLIRIQLKFSICHCIQRKKEEIWLSPMTEALTPTEKSKKQRDNTKNATKNFDYITIADRLRTVSWGNDSHPAGVVKPVYGIPTFPLTAKAV